MGFKRRGRAKILPERRVMLKRLLFASLAYALAAPPAHASFLSGEMLDTAADILAIVVLFLVPVVGIVLFWIVHVLPEKIADKRHHPQTRGDHHALPAVARVRRAALAARLALGVHQADRLSHGLRHRQARRLLRRDGPEAPRGQARCAKRACHLREELEAMEARGALPPSLSAPEGRTRAAAARARRPTRPPAGAAKDKAA